MNSRSNLIEEDSIAIDDELDWVPYLDDIANGVEVRLDSLIGHIMAEAIIEKTIAIAQSMSIPEEHIEKWVDARRKTVKRIKILDLLLERAGQMPIAQGENDLFSFYCCDSKTSNNSPDLRSE